MPNNNQFKMKYIRFVNMKFSQNKPIENIDNIKLGIGLAVAYLIYRDNSEVQLDMQLKVELIDTNDDIIWGLETKLSSFFEFSADFDKEELRQLLPMLYLHSKPVIIHMACISDIPLFTLPDLDFNDKNIELIDISENNKTNN
ncbi:hypothetical protein [Brachyspira pulli]|uniref:hypothetical protein n=1 Tax=Brachyspira pulli TaxID=310721 RepID=UPI003004A244